MIATPLSIQATIAGRMSVRSTAIELLGTETLYPVQTITKSSTITITVKKSYIPSSFVSSLSTIPMKFSELSTCETKPLVTPSAITIVSLPCESRIPLTT